MSEVVNWVWAQPICYHSRRWPLWLACSSRSGSPRAK